MLFKLVIKLFLLLLISGEIEVFSQETPYPQYVINTLASEKYQGRGYCGKADLKAARFIAGEFLKSGIKAPLKDYFQDFYINVNTFPGKMEVRLNTIKLQPGKNFLVDPASSSLSGRFKVVRFTRTELANKEKLEDILKNIDGKALLIDMNDTLKFSSEEEERINKLIKAIKYDPGIQNPLTIVFSDKKLTWSISGWQAKKAVVTVSSDGLDPLNINEVEINITAVLKENYRTQNVIGMIPGTRVPDSFLVVTSHYDHLGSMGKNTVFTGANDNASGVAMMLSLSKYFVTNPPAYSILFIAFSAEELGLLGSIHYTGRPVYDIKKIKFLVNFDLAGTGDEGIKVVNGTIFKQEFEKLQEINSANNLLPSVQSRGEACISDHCIFYKSNVPSFYIYTLGGISAYHDIYDRPETLPLTEFDHYFRLMGLFLESF